MKKLLIILAILSLAGLTSCGEKAKDAVQDAGSAVVETAENAAEGADAMVDATVEGADAMVDATVEGADAMVDATVEAALPDPALPTEAEMTADAAVQ